MDRTYITNMNMRQELFDPKQPEIAFHAKNSAFVFYANAYKTPFKISLDGQDYVSPSINHAMLTLQHLETAKKGGRCVLGETARQIILNPDAKHSIKVNRSNCQLNPQDEIIILKDLLRCKFTQHPALLCLLLRDHGKIISDEDKLNTNSLGKLLMELRADFKIELDAYGSIRVISELSWQACQKLDLIYNQPRIIHKITIDMLEHIKHAPMMQLFLTKKKPRSKEYNDISNIHYLNFSLSKLSLDVIQDIIIKASYIRSRRTPGNTRDASKALLKTLSTFTPWLKNILSEQTKKNKTLQTIYAKNKNFNDKMNAYKDYMQWTKAMQESITKQEIIVESAIDKFIHTPDNIKLRLCRIIIDVMLKHRITLSFTDALSRTILAQELSRFIANQDETPDYWLAISLRDELLKSESALIRDIFCDEKIATERKVIGTNKPIVNKQLLAIIKLAKKHFEPEMI